MLRVGEGHAGFSISMLNQRLIGRRFRTMETVHQSHPMIDGHCVDCWMDDLSLITTAIPTIFNGSI